MPRYRLANFPPLGQWRTEVDRLFDDLITPVARAAGRVGSYPAINLWEHDNTLYAEAELPGVRSEDLDIAVIGDELTIKGRRAAEAEAGLTVFRRERVTGEFGRVIKLPYEIDATKVEASLTDGVLRVVLPKAESLRPHKVQVTTK